MPTPYVVDLFDPTKQIRDKNLIPHSVRLNAASSKRETKRPVEPKK